MKEVRMQSVSQFPMFLWCKIWALCTGGVHSKVWWNAETARKHQWETGTTYKACRAASKRFHSIYITSMYVPKNALLISCKRNDDFRNTKVPFSETVLHQLLVLCPSYKLLILWVNVNMFMTIGRILSRTITPRIRTQSVSSKALPNMKVLFCSKKFPSAFEYTTQELASHSSIKATSQRKLHHFLLFSWFVARKIKSSKKLQMWMWHFLWCVD